MGLVSAIRGKLRSLTNRVTRPSAVTEAQHRHLKAFPRCAACGVEGGGQAHHVKPYNRFPELAADPNNFITLCEHVGGLECHLHVGHGGNFKMFNPDVVQDADDFRQANDARRRVLLDAIRAKRQPDVP